jgi:hypothetical protein
MYADGKHQVLRDGLRSFGLDPREWKLQEKEGNQMLIHHIQEEELQMLGTAYATDSKVSSSWYWSEIHIGGL